MQEIGGTEMANKKQKRRVARAQVRMRRRSMGSKDVQIMALTLGAKAVKEALESAKVGVGVARKAAEELRSNRASLAAELLAVIDQFAPAKARGRTAPVAGEARHYRVQVIGEGEPFIRLPTSLLEEGKGGTVVAHFHHDRIVVQRN
jgi:hypothetical protein